jgi:hypothetical protein
MRYSKATWKGEVPNRTPGGMDSKILGVVLHIMEGTLDGTDAWFKNPKVKASSHFGVGKDGRTYQWVDTVDKAWAQAAGNPNYISIENEGHYGDALTDPQLNAVAEIVGWVSRTYGMPLRKADHPGETGLGWHEMGGAAWGGHPCPGSSIVNQRDQILRKAGGKGTVPPMFNPAIGPIAAAAKWPDGGVVLVSPGGAVYALFGAPYCGGANGQPYFSGRQAAGFEVDATGVAVKTPRGGYTIVATSGEKYSYPV